MNHNIGYSCNNENKISTVNQLRISKFRQIPAKSPNRRGQIKKIRRLKNK